MARTKMGSHLGFCVKRIFLCRRQEPGLRPTTYERGKLTNSSTLRKNFTPRNSQVRKIHFWGGTANHCHLRIDFRCLIGSSWTSVDWAETAHAPFFGQLPPQAREEQWLENRANRTSIQAKRPRSMARSAALFVGAIFVGSCRSQTRQFTNSSSAESSHDGSTSLRGASSGT